MKRVSAPGYDLFKPIITLILVAILVLLLLRGRAAKCIPASTTGNIATEAPENVAPSPLPIEEIPTLTPTEVPTESPAPSPTPATTPEASEEEVSCKTSVPSLLGVGQKASILNNLNMRTDASIEAQIISTNLSGRQIEIIGGPICTPRNDSAYLWWQIRTEAGQEGWSAESPLNEAKYFLEPVSQE